MMLNAEKARNNEDGRKQIQSRFNTHFNHLVWKCYMQRQRRWRSLLAETLVAGVLFLTAVFIAKPVFLTPLEAEPEAPLGSLDIYTSMLPGTILGYAPNTDPYVTIMARTSDLLGISIMAAPSLNDLNIMLHNLSRGTPIMNKVTWVIWKPQVANVFKFSIRSSEVARYASQATNDAEARNLHLRTGFLGVQLAVSQAILEYASPDHPVYELSLVSMPVSPLMEEDRVRRAISGILLCYTLALLSPVLATESLVVTETRNRFKRALRIRNVDYSSMYISWLVYAFLTALPICLLGSIALILIFRWVHLLYALVILLLYNCLMIMLALIMAMFHSRAWIACVWTTLFTLMQTFLAELMVHHKYDDKHGALTFLVHMFLPPLGLVHGLNHFALLRTGQGYDGSLASWVFLIIAYFLLLMLLQRTITQDRAIGGQVSWKSIIFKKVEDVNKLRNIARPTGNERANLQEVDEFLAKAISFRNVSKSIMNVPVLSSVTFDIYRGEFTILIAERIQDKMMNTVEDLLTGLTHADHGTINVLGVDLEHGHTLMSEPMMMGYCDQSAFLVEDLTVEENLTFFFSICMWAESSQFVREYIHIRSKRLKRECDLESVWNTRVKHLGYYYRAQLCWAIAIMLEPRVIILPNFTDHPDYLSVIKDKIMQYKKYITIVKISYSSIHIEYADRVFVFDNKIIAFGGTPAFMFFKFGREYRFRLTIRNGGKVDEESTDSLISLAEAAGATVRAHLGSLLILRLPTSPTDKVAALVKHLTDNSKKYGITSMNISLPDTEEVYNRAITESRVSLATESPEAFAVSKNALQKLSEARNWQSKRTQWCNLIHLRSIGWKYLCFYIHFRFFLIITVISALVAGVFLGLALSAMLVNLDRDHGARKMIFGDVLTVESLQQKTTLVLRLDNSSESRSVANAYVLSQTNATQKDIENMEYTALSSTESLTEYLITRAIDSPQHYVYKFAYGMDVASDGYGNLVIQALYSPLHHDHGAAARSLARVYMALMRHYTSALDASIEVTDDPLVLDQTPWMKHASTPPLLIQFLLILTISHITLLPSKEHGLIRHMQTYALNFSPARYWFALYFCDLILYWLLVAIMTAVLGSIMLIIVPLAHFQFRDLVVVPFMLVIYGLGCIPQAYLFSLGPRAPLNSMAFIIVNIVFGEATILAKLFYGNVYIYLLNTLALLSPQYNMAYALVKIKQTFLYNTECIIIKAKDLCNISMLHKCCEKCGVLQECFKRKSYLVPGGILPEVTATLATSVVFMALLLLWEYRAFQRGWNYILRKWAYRQKLSEEETMGVQREKADVMDKSKQLKKRRNTNLGDKVDTFGEYLLATNISRKVHGQYVVRNVYLGLGKGEALALSGLKRHGRLHLCEMLAGFKLPNEGQIRSMSRWKLTIQPHMFSRQISLCCDRAPLPEWMTVYDALELLATLRGVPKRHINEELTDYIEALDLLQQADTKVCRLLPNDKIRVHFAAAVIGAPPVIVLDECTAYQSNAVRRAMYYILFHLRKRGHAIVISSSNVESHLPVTNRLAIIVDGRIFDIDSVDKLVERHSTKGYTVVVHLKDEVDVVAMFSKYFESFVVNDTSEVLVNIQVLDVALNWAQIFEKMERLEAENQQVYSYIVTAIPIDYIYNNILYNEVGNRAVEDMLSRPCLKKLLKEEKRFTPLKEVMDNLVQFENKYDITTLKDLPWSVIFQR